MFQNILQWLADNRPLIIGVAAVLAAVAAAMALWRPSPQQHFVGPHGGRRCDSKELHPFYLWPIIWLWAESGPIMALFFLAAVGACLLALAALGVALHSEPLMFGSLIMFAYFLASIEKVETATWLTLTVGGGRLKATMIEGWRFIPRWFIKSTPYSAEQEPISVEGHADLRDGSIQRYKGTISIIRDRHIVDNHGRPRYPEADKILKDHNGLPDRFKRAIETLLSFCVGDDLLQKDEAVLLALSAIMRMRVPPHMTAGPNGTALPSDRIIDYYDTNKALAQRLLHEEQSFTDTELQFATEVIECGVTFDADLDLLKAQQGLRKAQLFRQAQLELERPESGKKEDPARMSPAESRKTMQLIQGVSTGTVVETSGGGAGGAASDPFGLIAGLTAAANILKGSQKKEKEEKS